jgi:hypothetical protein
VFSIVRRKSRSQLVRQELGQSVEHFKQAANHAAQGTGATVGPKFYAARDRVQPAAGRVKDVAATGWGSAVATVSPLATVATSNLRKADAETRKNAAKKQAKLQKATIKAVGRTNKAAGKAKAKAKSKDTKKKSKLTSLLLAGAAIGAAAAYVVRRRNSQQWDEYDPSRPVGSTTETTGTIPADEVVFEPAEPAGTAAFTTPTPAPVSESGTVSGTSTLPVVGKETEDQTSSALHTPNVARMAGGGSKS